MWRPCADDVIVETLILTGVNGETLRSVLTDTNTEQQTIWNNTKQILDTTV